MGAIKVIVAVAALVGAQVPVDKTPYCCAGINDCEIMNGDTCPNGPGAGPMSYGQCIGMCYKVGGDTPGTQNVTLAACDASDNMQTWAARTDADAAGDYVDVTRNVGSGLCLGAIQVDPVQVFSCIETPGSADYSFINGSVAVTGGMMHGGFCVEDLGSGSGLRECDGGNAAQKFTYDAKTGRLSRGGRCLAVDAKAEAAFSEE
jgi:hypothetical protein